MNYNMQHFSQQQSGGYQHQQNLSNPQNNYLNSHQQHPQLWTAEQNNYPQQPSSSNNNNNNGFNSNNMTKGADINNSNTFRSSNSNTGNHPISQSNVSQQGTTAFNQAVPLANQVGQHHNGSTIVNPAWVANSHQNIDPNWQQNMGSNVQQPQNPNPLQTQPQQSSLQRTFDYVQQCQNWST